MPDERDSLNETQEREGESAPAGEPAQPCETPPSLRSVLEEKAQAAGIGTSFLTSSWMAKVRALHERNGVSETALVRAFETCLETRPGKVAFFADDYSRYFTRPDNVVSFPSQDHEDTGRVSVGIDLESRLCGKYQCPKCGKDQVHEVYSNYVMCERCGYQYGKPARDHFAEERIPAEAVDSVGAEVGTRGAPIAS